MRLLALSGLLAGCGHLVRFEAGPTWLEGQGLGGTAQVTTGVAVVAGSGLYDFLVVGAYGTTYGADLAGGLFLGCDAGVTPGGFDQPAANTRDGVGGGLRFHPRFGTDTPVALGGGLTVVGGEGVVGPGGHVSLSDHEKSGLSIHWDRRSWANFGAAVDIAHTLVDGDIRRGIWRIDLFGVAEHMEVTE